ncbi:MAG: hypothetical protein K6B72_05385 [Lachnospiraceae bacterium]|nr:hypothetical protein [Lachnospiraceae bacterium]
MRVFRITKEAAPMFAEFIPEYVLTRIDKPGFHTTGEAVTDGDMYYAAGFLQYYDGEMCEQDSVRLLYIYVPEDERGEGNAWSLLHEMDGRLKEKGIGRAEIWLSGEQRELLEGYFVCRGYAVQKDSMPLIRTTLSDLKSETLLKVPVSAGVRTLAEMPRKEVQRILEQIPEEQLATVGVRADGRIDTPTKKLSLVYHDQDGDGVLMASPMPEGGILIRCLRCFGKNTAKVSGMLLSAAWRRLDGSIPSDTPVYIYNIDDRAVRLLDKTAPDAEISEVWRGVKML